MANMSYCRFNNTLGDLRDCEQHMTDNLSASPRADGYDSEHSKRTRLLELCIRIASEYGETDAEGMLTGKVKPVEEWEEPEENE